MILYEIPWSHYCEKARFCLDYKGLAYRRIAVSPATRREVRRIGARGLVPVLQDGAQVVEGSDAIAAHLDVRQPEPALVPRDAGARAEVLGWQRRLDEELGPDARRVGYAVALEHPRMFLGSFLATRPPKSWLNPVLRPVIVMVLRRRFEITPARIAESGARLRALLGTLRRTLEGRRFLVGDRLTLADIAAVSLMDPLEIVPEFVREPGWAPVFEWKRAIGRAHRRPMRAPWIGGAAPDGRLVEAT